MSLDSPSALVAVVGDQAPTPLDPLVTTCGAQLVKAPAITPSLVSDLERKLQLQIGLAGDDLQSKTKKRKQKRKCKSKKQKKA